MHSWKKQPATMEESKILPCVMEEGQDFGNEVHRGAIAAPSFQKMNDDLRYTNAVPVSAKGSAQTNEKCTTGPYDATLFSCAYEVPREPQSNFFVFNRTTVFCEGEAHELANSLASFLHRPECIVTLKPHKYTIKASCIMAPDDVAIKFNLYKSSVGTMDAIAIEATRLSGDSLSFNRMFNAVVDEMKKRHIVLALQGVNKHDRKLIKNIKKDVEGKERSIYKKATMDTDTIDVRETFGCMGESLFAYQVRLDTLEPPVLLV